MENTKQLEKEVLEFKHDIRNPLYIVKSLIETHLEYLDRGLTPANAGPSGQTRTVLTKSIKEIDRVLSTIRRLNQIAKGRARSCAEPVCVKEILSRTVQALKEGRYLDHLVLTEQVAADLPKLKVNLIDLEEIFFNLIVNAAQAVRQGGSLSIRYFRQMNPARSVAVSFRDTGCGIPEEALPHIFEPFYTGRAEAGGVGFGLYIVKQLVERNGGRIDVESKPGLGTTFTLTFPLPV